MTIPPIHYDTIIVGGSYAGLSAAMALGRSLRKVLIIDSGSPCNRKSPHSHNFLTQDGASPREISTVGRQQVLSYETVKFYEGKAEGAVKNEDGSFKVKTERGEEFFGTKLIVASGIKDVMPDDLKGFSDCWGVSVIHCPYCHGFENRNKKTGIIANGPIAEHLVPLIYNLSKQLKILTNGQEDNGFEDEQLEKFASHNISVLSTKLKEIVHVDGQLSKVIFEDETEEDFEIIYASLPFEQSTDIPKNLGCEFDEKGFLVVDPLQKTSLEGVFGCGDCITPFRSVANAVSSGCMAGAMANKELADDEF